MIKVSDYLVQVLIKCGVKTYFGVQGGAIAHVIESSAKKAEYIPVFNEQSAGLSAHGYYFANNKPAATLVTTGPGFLNSVTGLAACYYDNVPAVFITGQVSKQLNLAEKFKMKMYGFQEVPHLEVGKKIAGNIFNINSEKSLVEFVKYLRDLNYKISSTILIEIQDAFSRKKITVPKLPKLKNKVIKNNLSLKNELSTFFKLLSNASKPVLLVGAGFKDLKSKAEITNFSKKFNIPLASTWGGSPLIEKNNKLYLGYFGTQSPGLANKKISSADLVICLGVSLLQHQCGKKHDLFAQKSNIIYINNDQNYLKRIKVDFGKRAFSIKSDSSYFIKESLKTRLKKSFRFNNSNTSNYVFQNDSKPVQILDKIFGAYDRLKTKKRKIVFSDAGATLSWSFQAANISKTVNLITAYNLHTMGYSLPAAIGASLNKNNYALALIGDGGFMMNCQELANFCRAKNNLKMIIIDNKGYGIIRQTQDDFFKSNYVGTKISLKNNLAEYNPANICKSFNIKTLSKNEDIKKSDIDTFFKSDYQCLVINVSHKYRVPYTYPKNKEVPFFY